MVASEFQGEELNKGPLSLVTWIPRVKSESIHNMGFVALEFIPFFILPLFSYQLWPVKVDVYLAFWFIVSVWSLE